MASVNSIVSIALTIDGRQAKLELEAMQEKVDRTKQKLEELQLKLLDKSKWGDQSEDMIKADIKRTERDLKSMEKMLDQREKIIKGINEVLADISKSSYNELTRSRGLLQSSIRSLNPAEEEYGIKVKQIQQLQEEIAKRQLDLNNQMSQEKATEVLGKPEDYSVKQIQDAVNVMTRLNKLQKENSQEWRESNSLIEAGNKHLEEFEARVKQLQMEDLHTKVYDGTISESDLNTIVRYWESMAAGADKNSTSLKYYNDLLKEGQDLLQQRTAQKTAKVMAAPADYSVNEINEAIEATRKLQAAQQPGSDAWKKYGEEIRNAKEILNQFNAEAKEEAMAKQLNRPSSLSVNALSEQKKYWQEMVNATDSLNPKLVEYKNNLQQVVDEERTRAKIAAEGIYSKVNSNAWKGTIGETKEAYEELKKYRDLYEKGLEDNEIKEIDKAVDSLSQKMKEARQNYISLAEALSTVDNLDTFDGTVEDLEKLKKRLEEIKTKELKLGDKGSKENIDKINAGLFKVEGKLKDVNAKAKSLDEILDNVGDSSLSDLERAAKELEDQISKVGKCTEEYTLKSAKLRDVNKQIDAIKANFKEKESIIIRTGKRLASYVAVYAGFNEIVGQLSRVVRANLELSDSLADIQKTTGLTASQVGKLSDQINAIDTRTAQNQLHALAYEAGKLGISAEEDVLAFVKAGNQLVVALGEDLGGAEAVRELMKVNAILGETDNLGMEKALLATGSAINEISQTSRASAGPIADVVSRIGAIGAAAKLQMSDLIALAGTADAMGQSAEVAGTAFNKFITTLQTNTVDVAYALGLDPKNLRSMLDAGQTMEAIIMIFERMNEMGDLSSFGGIFKELGSEGARMSQVLATMAAGVDELKSQVFTSNKAFREATSVTNEYNIKNESAAAILERMGNNLRESFTNSGFVEWIRDVLQWLYYLPQSIENSRVALTLFRAVMWEIVMVSGAKLIAMLGSTLKDALKALSLQVDMGTKAWKAYYVEIAKAKFGLVADGAIKAASGVTKLRIAFMTLTKVLISNPIFLFGTALATAVTAFQYFRQEVDKNVKSMAELESAVQNEQYAMRKLLEDINNANGATGERAALIKELNNKYGNYLGFLVTESNYVENQAYIYDLLNAKLRESLTLKMNNKMMDDISTKYAGDRNKANKDILEGLYSMPSIGESKAPEYMQKVMGAVLEQVKKGSKDADSVMQQVFGDVYQKFMEGKKKLDEQVNAGTLSGAAYSRKLNELRKDTVGEEYDELASGIKRMLEVETNISNETRKVQTIISANTKAVQESAIEITKEKLDSQFSALTGKESVDQLKALKQQTESYIKTQQDGIADLVQKKKALKGLTFEEQQEFETLGKEMTKTVEITDEMGNKTQQSVKPAQELIDRYNYLNHKKTIGLNLSDEEEEKIEATNAEIKRMEQNLVGVNEKLAESGHINAWGSSKDLEAMSGKQLSALYKKLQSDAGLLAADAGEGIQTQFWKNFSTRDKAVAWYKEQSEAIAAQLRKLGMDTNANWLKNRGESEKKTAQQLYRELLAELEAYYNERETAIRKRGMEEGRLESEINRDIENLQMQEWNDRIELEKALLDKFYKQSTFDPSKYMGDLTKMPYFAGVKMEEVRQAIRAAGPKLEADIVKSMTGSMVKTEEKLYQIKQRIEKILLEDDFSEQVAQQYLGSLDQLGLLFNIETEKTEHTQEESELRLAVMRDWSKKSYQMTVDDLKAKIAANKMFSEWRIGRDEEDYEALLLMLRKYNDDSIDAVKKAADQRKKIIDVKWNTKDPKTGKSQKEVHDERITGEEADLEMYEAAERLGLGSQRRVDDAQIAVYEAKIRASQAYIEQIKLELEAEKWKAREAIMLAEQELARKKAFGVDTTEAEAAVAAAKQRFDDIKMQGEQMILQEQQNILEQKKNISNVELSIEERKMNTLKGYTDNIVSFGEQMGEAAWGSVEDRQEAGKALLKNTLQLTKDLIMAEVKRLIMKKALGQQEVVQEQTKEQQITLTKGEHQIANLSADAAAAQGENAINTSRAGGKTLAELGWWGIPLIAVISAALSALLGAAMGAFSKAKSEVSAATGASSGRLATGMLTYADGKYPTLGNDGVIYDAKYEGSNIKTGIYRGGAHFGIFSEKKPEAIIDGDTTQRLIMNHPDIWKAIVTLSKNGRLESGMGMRTFATGNIDQLAKQASQAETQAATAQNEAQNAMMERMEALLAANVNLMNKLATEGVQSRINMYGGDGLYKNMEKAKKYANRVGYR